MHDRSNGWAAALQATASIRNTPTTMRFMYFYDTQAAKDECEREIESISTS